MSGAEPAAVPEPRANPLLLGHAAVEAAWLRAWRSGRLPHGWLLTGPQGVGKATLAYRLARRLLAGRPEDPLPPGPESAPFRMIAKGAHPDLHLLTPDLATARRLRAEIKVDEVRERMAALAATSAMGGARVLVVDPADALNRNAANALLKLLEEPPAGVVIFLVCQRPGLLPRTILSRTARLRLLPLPPAAMAEGLARLLPDAAPERRRLLADLAGGSLGRALELEARGWPEAYGRLLEQLEALRRPQGQPLALAEHLAEITRRQGFAQAVELMAGLCRRAARLGALGAPALELVPDEAARLGALGLGLDRWTGLWDKLAAAAQETEALNLDPLQSFLGLAAGIRADAGP